MFIPKADRRWISYVRSRQIALSTSLGGGMDMRHHVDLGSGETPGRLRYLVTFPCVFVHLLHRLTLGSTCSGYGSARVGNAGGAPYPKGSTGHNPGGGKGERSRRGLPWKREDEARTVADFPVWEGMLSLRHQAAKAVHLDPIHTIAEA